MTASPQRLSLFTAFKPLSSLFCRHLAISLRDFPPGSAMAWLIILCGWIAFFFSTLVSADCWSILNQDGSPASNPDPHPVEGRPELALKWIPKACQSRLSGSYDSGVLKWTCVPERPSAVHFQNLELPQFWSFYTKRSKPDSADWESDMCEASLRRMIEDCGKFGGVTTTDGWIYRWVIESAVRTHER